MRRPRSRKGVSTVIGTVFFVLIVFVFLGSLVVIFSSFNGYISAWKVTSQQEIQNKETVLSIPQTSFPKSYAASTPSTVSTTTSRTGTSYSEESKIVYSQGLWWVFFSTGSQIDYATSADGSTWSAAQLVTSSSGSAFGYAFSVWLSGNTIYYVLASPNNAAQFLWRYGTLDSGGTISWTIAETTVPTTSGYRTDYYDSITLDGSGNVWVGLSTYDSKHGNYYVEVYEYAGGTWSQSYSSCICSAATPSIILPLTSGIGLVYSRGSASTDVVDVLTTNGGGGWSTIVSPASDYEITHSSAISIGNTIYFVGMASASAGSTTGTVKFWTFTYGGGATSAETTLDATTSGWYSSISSGGSSDIVAFYGSGTNVYYVSSTNTGTSWSSRQTISTAETTVTGLNSANSALGLSWVSGSGSPYNVRFASVTVDGQIVISISSSTPFAVHLVSLYVFDTNTSLLAAHYDTNASAPGVSAKFDYWVGGGASISVTENFDWIAYHNYLLTVDTDQGVMFSASFVAP